MSDYLESLFKGVDILIDKKLESLAYDTTDICTITDNSESKNGKYRVTDGSVSYIAYSDTDNFKVGDQVRVNIPNNDYTQQKFIVGKYTSEDSTKPITYVSPLDNVVNITGNLTKILGNSAFGIIANGATRKRILWNQSLQPELFRDLRANGIYDTLILKADFKTDLGSFNYVEGSYGLIIDLLITPSPGSPIKIKRSVELSSKEMFGNPYNFAIYSPQEKAFSITTSGVIEGIELSIYQNGDFKDSKGNYPVDRLENIFVKNIEIGFGSNILNVEDNVVRIYSENGLAYRNKFHSASTNLKKMGLVWYNKDEVNRYVGFSDGVYSQSYDELNYLEKVHQDTRLLEQQGRDNMPYDELGLTFAANIAESIPALTKVLNILTQDLYTEINYLMTKLPIDSSMRSAFESLQDTITDNAMAAEGVILELKQFYNDILIYACKRQNGLDATMPNLSTNYYEKFFNILKNITTSTVDASTDISISDCLSWILSGDVIQAPDLGQGYSETYNNFIARVGRLIDKAQLIINNLSVVNSSKIIQEFNSIITYVTNLATNGNYYKPYTEKDLSQYDNKYCIYWYRYEDGYVDESDEYKLMPEGWRKLTSDELKEHHPLKVPYVSTPSRRYANNKGELILNAEGKATHDIQCSSEEGFVYRYMQHDWKEEKYVAIVFYNHEMYRSNELVFTNQDAVADIDTLDKSDALKFEHISYSTDAYYLYNEMFLLKDAMDSRRQREIRCRYDGRRAKDEALNGADIYWYIPLTSTMITYDKQYLIDQGFDTDDGNKFHYSKDGYICFYKRASGEQKKNAEDILEWDFRQVLTESEDDPTYGPDTRSFWYQIKPRLESNTVNNHILCAVAPAGETETVESLQLFAFGLGGTNGTAYTFAIDNATSLQTAITNDNPLLLNISIRNGNNQLVPLKDDQNVSVRWDSYGGDKKFNEGEIDLNYAVNSLTIENGDRWGVLDARATLHLENEKNPDKGRKIILDCQYPVPWSAKLSYRLSGGDIYIAYTNAGTLNSLTTFDEPFKLIDGLAEAKEVDSWKIKPYKINASRELTEITEPAKSDADIEAKTKEWNFYSQYCPKLDPENRLIPSPLFLADANFVPVLIAYNAAGNPIFIQPIVLMQSQYPSQLLNDWDGKLQINEANGTILSSLVGTGRKNEFNAFDGVLMGDIALEAGIDITQDMGMGIMSGLGLYGFHDGAQSFGFNINGQAFIGKAGGARIFFDGNAGFIASANWFMGKYNEETDTYDQGGSVNAKQGIVRPSTAGMCIDLVNGHLDAFDFRLSSDNITLNSHPASGEYFFSVGNDDTGKIALGANGDLVISVNSLWIGGKTVQDLVNTSVSGAMDTFKPTQQSLFDTLFLNPEYETNPDAPKYIQGIALINEKIYISGEIMQTGMLKSANFNGTFIAGPITGLQYWPADDGLSNLKDESEDAIFKTGNNLICSVRDATGKEILYYGEKSNSNYWARRAVITPTALRNILNSERVYYTGKSWRDMPAAFLCEYLGTSVALTDQDISINGKVYKLIAAIHLPTDPSDYLHPLDKMSDLLQKIIYYIDNDGAIHLDTPDSTIQNNLLSKTDLIIFQSVVEDGADPPFDVTAGAMRVVPNEEPAGMCINLSSGELWSPSLTISNSASTIMGGWVLDQKSLSYVSEEGFKEYRNLNIPDYVTTTYWHETPSGNTLTLSGAAEGTYYKRIILGTGSFSSSTKFKYTGDRGDAPAFIFLSGPSTVLEEINPTSSEQEVSVPSGATQCVIQAASSNITNFPFSVIAIDDKPYCSSLFGDPTTNIHGDDPIFYLGAPQKIGDTWEYWKSLFSVSLDGTIHCGYQPGEGFMTICGQSLQFSDNEGNTMFSMGAESVLGTNKEDKTQEIHDEMIFTLHSTQNDAFKFNLIQNGTAYTLVAITDPSSTYRSDDSIIHTTGITANTFGAVSHLRKDCAVGKFGVGSIPSGSTTKGSVAIEHLDEKWNIPLARLDVYQSAPNTVVARFLAANIAPGHGDWTTDITTKPNITNQSSNTYFDNGWQTLTFTKSGNTCKMEYGGILVAKHVANSSSVDIKENINTVDTIINLFERDRSTIYNYNLKASNNHDKPDNYGFVIGEGYNTPKEVIMPDGQSINLYSMAALNWQATQEILERLKYIEDKMEKKEI